MNASFRAHYVMCISSLHMFKVIHNYFKVDEDEEEEEGEGEDDGDMFEESDDDGVNDKAWGKRKKTFYNTGECMGGLQKILSTENFKKCRPSSLVVTY